MSNPSGNILQRAIIQQLSADRLLGARTVPIPRSVLQSGTRVASSQTQSGVAISTVEKSTGEQNSRAEDNAKTLQILNESKVKNCKKCELCESRTQTVFGQGCSSPRLVFVGEAPGYEEDKKGLAFVGRAGQLLTRMIEAMGLRRDDVFICNVLKCRPPNNRDPSATEVLACSPFLREQLNTLRPEVLVALGAPAAKTLLNTTQGIGRLRGRFHDYYLSGITGEGPSIPLMPTYHPAYLLRSPGEKQKAWDDLQMVMATLGLTQP